MTQQSRVIFSFDKDEILPTFLGWGHGLKEENICWWETVSCEKKQDGTRKEYIKKAFYKNIPVDIFLTITLKNEYDTFEKGVIRFNNKEYDVIDYKSYYSLQIDKWCYDNISAIKLPCNIFDSTTISANGTSFDSGLNASTTTRIANMMTAPEISS